MRIYLISNNPALYWKRDCYLLTDVVQILKSNLLIFYSL